MSELPICHVCQKCGRDFPVQWGDTDAYCDDCAEQEALNDEDFAEEPLSWNEST